MKTIITFILVGCSLLFLQSCSNKKEENTEQQPEQKTSKKVQQDTIKTALEKEVLQDVTQLPSPLQIAVMFGNLQEPPYNNLPNVKTYTNKEDKLSRLLQMGSASSLLSFAIIDTNESLAGDVLSFLSQRSEETNFANVFNTEENLNYLKENINNKDSIMQFISKIQYSYRDNMSVNKFQDGLVVFIGGWITTLQAVGNSQTLYSNMMLLSEITEQGDLLEAWIDLAHKYNLKDRYPEVGDYLESLVSFKDFILSLNEAEELTIDKSDFQSKLGLIFELHRKITV